LPIAACESSVDKERRNVNIPIPDNLEEVLNKAQLQALSGLKYTGWELRFLRRPLFQEPIPVVYNTKDGRIGIVDYAGNLRIQTHFKERKLD
jgi:hypothetical protein